MRKIQNSINTELQLYNYSQIDKMLFKKTEFIKHFSSLWQKKLPLVGFKSTPSYQQYRKIDDMWNIYKIHFQSIKLLFLTMAKFTPGNVWIRLWHQSFSLPAPWDFNVCHHSTRSSQLGLPSILEVCVLSESQTPLSCPQQSPQSHPLQRWEAEFGVSVYKYSWPFHKRVFLVLLFM